MELVVTDDGSNDESLSIVSEFAAQAEFPVKLTTHVHDAYQISRCRNEGAIVSAAPYLLFIDGDCVIPSNHITAHLKRRRPGTVMAGDCCRLTEETSALVNLELHRTRTLELGISLRAATAATPALESAALSTYAAPHEAEAGRQQRGDLARRLRVAQRLRRTLRGLGL